MGHFRIALKLHYYLRTAHLLANDCVMKENFRAQARTASCWSLL
jgi:hypothetical protein